MGSFRMFHIPSCCCHFWWVTSYQRNWRASTGGCGNRFCLQLNGSFPCGKAIGVSRYFLRLAWVLHDSLKVARLNLAATSMGIPMETMVYRCCPDSHFCHDFSNLYLYLVILSRGHMLVAACGCCLLLLPPAPAAASCCCCFLLRCCCQLKWSNLASEAHGELRDKPYRLTSYWPRIDLVSDLV